MLKKLFSEGLLVYVVNGNKLTPVYLKIIGTEVTISAATQDGEYLGDGSLEEIKKLDNHLHDIGVHEEGECLEIDQSKKVIIDLK